MDKFSYIFGSQFKTMSGLRFGRAKRILHNKGFYLEEHEREGRSWWFAHNDSKRAARLFWDESRKSYTIHYQ